MQFKGLRCTLFLNVLFQARVIKIILPIFQWLIHSDHYMFATVNDVLFKRFQGGEVIASAFRNKGSLYLSWEKKCISSGNSKIDILTLRFAVYLNVLLMIIGNFFWVFFIFWFAKKEVCNESQGNEVLLPSCCHLSLVRSMQAAV